ncbi:unnamed protein product [Calypogeia fissa]
MDFNEIEATEGLRLAWNAWPSSRIEATRLVVPFGVMCTPLTELEGLQRLPYDPLLCKGCRAVLNPYCRVDYQAKIWVCPFCYQRNHFPQAYHQISDHNMPAELFPECSSVEYLISQPVSGGGPNFNAGSGPYGGQGQPGGGVGLGGRGGGPGFLFVLDTCMEAADLQALKTAITQMLGIIPQTALVGLITFGTMVYVHELGYLDCSKAYVFSGDKDISGQQLQEELGISSKAIRKVGQLAGGGGRGRFMLPLSECEFTLANALEDLQPCSNPVKAGYRPQRATGAALAVAAGLLEGIMPHEGARIMTFVSGPTTVGPGQIVDTDLGNSIRTHHDLVADRVPFLKKASKFYDQLAHRLVDNSHVLDLFACSLDQVGTYESKETVESTGGLIVLAETFDSDQFKRSLQKLFEKDEEGHLKMCFSASLEVITTREIKVCGAIGPCSSLDKKTPAVSDSELGMGGTSAWKFCTLNKKTAVAIFFEIVNQHSNPIPSGTYFFIQFVTQYQHGTGQWRLRVTTTARRWVDAAQVQELAAGFDQEAAAALMARLAVYKTKSEEVFDILRWLDRMLIRVAAKFGDYQKDDPSSFRLSTNFSLYPQFMFHLRRSQFLQVFNNTPDETAYFRLMLNREGVVGSVIMIQPTLLSYSFDGPCAPVLLDVSSIAPDRILLFDSYFFIVVHYGSTIAQWRKLGYHNDPNHENFRKLLEAPVGDAHALLDERIPMPRLIECDQHGSQARFLLAKLNPSVTHNSSQGSGELIFTDDVSLQVFIDHLQKLAVQS